LLSGLFEETERIIEALKSLPKKAIQAAKPKPAKKPPCEAVN
jgi:hypothetical protein